ncbi:DUF6776 family protein [Thiorhodovibrio winogradskyi]|nr:DUF6776 family protein [Thiorhodovibrio winogradskyi]
MGQVKVRRIRRPHIIDTRPTGRLGLALILVAIAFASWAYLLLDLTGEQSPETSGSPETSERETRPPSDQADATELQELEQRRLALAQNNAELEQRLRTLSQYQQTESNAEREAQETIRQLQSENAKLRSQIAFLSQLFGGDDGPIEISDLALSSAGENRVRYWFKIARTKAEKNMITGQARVQLRGQMAEGERYFSLSELTADGRDGHRLGFRHFQEIDGTLTLPPGFEPEELLVIVVPDDTTMGGARRQFEWKLGEDAD